MPSKAAITPSRQGPSQLRSSHERAGSPFDRATGPAWHRVVVAAMAAVAFGLSLVMSTAIFPLYSLNHDEPMYVLEAKLLQTARVTLPAKDAEFFRPWAAGIRGDRVVMKYTPPWPAVLAAFDAAGVRRLAPASVAAATVAAVYLLVLEVTRRRRAAVIAAGIVSLSPAVVLLSGTFLPYHFQLLLSTLFAYLLLSGARRRSRARLVLAGLAIGVALFARPFDALLVGSPFVVAMVVQGRREPRALASCLLKVAAGAAPVLAVMLLYNAHTMFHPLRLPYGVTGPYDRLGFGRRGVFPQYTIHYGPGEAIDALENVRALPSWVFGGAVTVVAAGVGLFTRRRRSASWWGLVSVAGIVPAGYLFFWSPYSIVKFWPGLERLGPYYHLPMLLPIAALAGVAFDSLLQTSTSRRALLTSPSPRGALGAGPSGPRSRRSERARRLGPALIVGALIVAMSATTAISLPPKISRNLKTTQDLRTASRAVSERRLGRALVFLPESADEGFASRTPFLEDDPSRSGKVLYAHDAGGANLNLINRESDRRPFRLDPEMSLSGHEKPALRPLRVRTEPAMVHTMSIRNLGGQRCVTAYALRSGSAPQRVVLDRSSRNGKTYRLTWTVHRPGFVGASPPELVVSKAQGGAMYVIGVAFGSSCRLQDAELYEVRFAFRTTDRNGPLLEVLEPGQAWQLRRQGAGRVWIQGRTGLALALEGD